MPAVLKNKWLLWLVVLGLVIAGLLIWRWEQRAQPLPELRLYGNIDLRQVALAFNNSERISEVLAQEGDKVQAGQVLARLDIARLTPRVAEVAAQTDAQQQVVLRMRHGSRPEEIAQARANLAAAKADADYAGLQYRRLQALTEESGGQAVSQQDLDNSRASLASNDARVQLQQKALDLAVLGPRQEDVAQAEAQLRGDQAQLAFLRQQIKDAELVAPALGIVRSRLLEPGELSTPQRPVFSLALIDPKWVRAYVSELDLGHVQPGMTAQVTVDSFPKQVFKGWVGFISPVAEFTPKAVQTEELRPSLAYEVRVFVKDPADALRLGMPATVTLPVAP
ncbi:efflux RND transporter periplasmic adaptor subunit [Methylomonas paludis]|uniref:Efflux RND transporter periplasmic adaptor subunit n=1 Tax=Methylomonas paludis TaxID=1173101 RepID=A0A975MR71_9GAMM|nr:efflux RND transporter periplasmic adaptor subunit [Methylomonas paludis]QWF72269.1 efflux RND transporter periplasmic adaptor subunit [Methylomonas paludis]